MPEDDTPTEWTEVNIEPISYERRERLLLDVVDPLIHQTLSGRIDAWHYFWEPALRLRVHWQQPTQADYTRLTDFLEAAKIDGKLADWKPGSHGDPGQTYQGEAPKFGTDIWPYTYRHWTTGCELALALAKRDPDNALTELSADPNDNAPREFHWVYAVHLFSNPLGLGHLDEGRWSLRHAWRQLVIANNADDSVARDQQVVNALHVIDNARNELDNTVRRLRLQTPQPGKPTA
jgi:hypothetical protein